MFQDNAFATSSFNPDGVNGGLLRDILLITPASLDQRIWYQLPAFVPDGQGIRYQLRRRSAVPRTEKTLKRITLNIQYAMS